MADSGMLRTVCSKEEVILRKHVSREGEYVATFEVRRPENGVEALGGTNIYTLLGALNPDLVAHTEVVPEEDGSAAVLLVFKRIAAELGLPQKYMTLSAVVAHASPGRLEIRAQDSASGPWRGPIPARCSKVVSNYIDLVAEEGAPGRMRVALRFSIDLGEQLPTYMRDLPGMLMLRILVRLKNHIDNPSE